MKLKRDRVEPILRVLLGKDTPQFDLDDERRLKIEQKDLGLPPKLQKEKIIVPA